MNAVDRRHFLQLAGAAGFGSLLPSAQAAVSAEAKAEGQAVFYANITAVDPLMKAFDAETGIRGIYTRVSSTKFLPTILTEFNAGKLLADVVQAPRPMLDLLNAHKVLAPYKSPEAAGYPEWATRDPRMTLFGIEYVSYLYNTERVKEADAPKRYEDLADPRWKDKIVMANPATHSSTIAWLVGLKEMVFKSESDWLAYVKGLAANRPMFVASFGPTPAPVESGEKLIGISMPKYIVTKAPAPLAWGPRGGQPLLGEPRAIGVAASAPHPAAARAFMDFWLSRKAMGLLAREVGEYVLAPGVYPPIKHIEQAKVLPVRDLSDAEIQKWGAEFRTLFAAR
jgi:iron(III) transport system substrate-binding protein